MIVSVDAALKITRVRGKNYLCPEVAGNLRLMAMVKYAVRLQANFTEAVADRGLTTRAAHSAGSVDYRPLVEIQQIGSISGFSDSCAAVG